MPYTAAQRHSAPGATRSFVDQEQPGLSDSKLQTTNAIRTVIDLVDTSENKLRTVRELQNDGRNNLEADDGTPYEYKVTKP